MISDLHIKPSFLSFFKIFFRPWENAARLFLKLSGVIVATLVYFTYFAGFYISLVFFLKPFAYPTYAAIVYKPFWCQIHCNVAFAQLVYTSNPSGIFGLNSSIKIDCDNRHFFLYIDSSHFFTSW